MKLLPLGGEVCNCGAKWKWPKRIADIAIWECANGHVWKKTLFKVKEDWGKHEVSDLRQAG